MAELRPHPFPALVRRMFRELETQGAIFDLPQRRFFRGDPRRDFGVSLHGRRVATALGPAAGPQTQMAQNIVLSWLGGCRVQELKTVQIQDELEIPRPCIDMRTAGLNIEWSQELSLEESLEEYVKGAMLVEMLAAGPVPPVNGFGDLAWDLSVGYDLAGVSSERVGAFVRGMQDAGETVDRLRRQIPPEHAALRDLEYPRRLSGSVTLSTFHGCPPDEIERIIEFLMREHGLDCVIKFNPMLVGRDETRRLLHDELGYRHLRVPDSAFERDTGWQQAVEIVGRLRETAAELGLGLGVKLTNTLIVENDGGFLSAEPEEAYLSGPPLHVLAMTLVRRFRRAFGATLPISFSAGIDRRNFADAVALGLVPVTVCSDLLEKGGYGRLQAYHSELAARMDAVGARDVGGLVLRAWGKGREALDRLGLDSGDPRRAACESALEPGGGGDPLAAAGPELARRWLDEVVLLNTEEHVAAVRRDPRYAWEAHADPPPKIDSHLELFDCITCDICVPVCPNDANFTFGAGLEEVPVERLERSGEGWRRRLGEPIELARRHQIANFADFCNDCGNCDVFCPEHGGPYLVKPRFFGRADDWRASGHLDGFYLERRSSGDLVLGRFDGREYRLESTPDRWELAGPEFRVVRAPSDPEGSLDVEASEDEIDLTWGHIMDSIRRAVLDGGRINPVNSLAETPGDGTERESSAS